MAALVAALNSGEALAAAQAAGSVFFSCSVLCLQAFFCFECALVSFLSF